MTYDLALRLKEARFPQSLHPNAEYYLAPGVVITRKDLLTCVTDEKGERIAANYFVFKPTADDLIKHFGLKKVISYLNGQDII